MSGGAGAVVRGGAVNVGGSLISMAVNFGLVIVVTRHFGADGAGVFFAAVALFMIVGTFATFGAETGLVYALSRARAQQRWAEVGPAVSAALTGSLVAAVGGAVLVFLLVPPGEAVAAGGFDDVARALAPFLPSLVAVQVLSGISRGFGAMTPTARDVHVLRPILQALGLGLVLLTGGGLVALALAWGVPLLATTATAAVTARRTVSGLPDSADEPRSGRARAFWRYAAPRGMANSLQAVQDRVGVVLVVLLSTAATGGVFVAVARIAGAFNLLIFAIGQALNPQVGALLAQDDRAGAERLTQQITAWTMLAVWPAAILVAVHAETVLKVFGPEFGSGTSALRLVMAVMVVTAALGHLDNVLLMGGRSRTSLANVAVSLVVGLGLNVALIPAHGIMGAAVAWSAGLLVFRVLPVAQVRRQLDIRPLGPEAAAVAVAASALLLVSVAARLVLGVGVVPALVTGLLALAVYGGVVWLLRDRIGVPLLLKSRALAPTGGE